MVLEAFFEKKPLPCAFFKYTKKLQNPSAFRIFTILLNEKKRTLITPIPGYSTHGETKYLTPFREWSKEL